jgi:hypothetical protein
MAYIGRKPSFSQVRTAELVVQRGTDITTSGTIAALDVSNISLVRLTAATILQGIAAPSAPADNGKRVTLINANSSDLIVRNESGSATAANRVSTGISRDMRITPGASLTLTYNTASSRWSVESSSAEINIDRLRVASEVVTLGPDISVLSTGNGKSTLLELSTGFGTSVRSLAAGLSGQFVVLVNKTGSLIQVANEDTGASSDDRILTGTGGPISLQSNASLFLAYLTDSSAASRWQVVGGTGSGGGATEQVTQTGIGSLAVGTPLYVDASTGWTAANASAANTAEVAGMLGRSLSANLAEVVMAGEVSGVTASVFTEAVLPARGEVVFLSATSGKLTITEPSVVGQVSKPLGVVHNVNGSTSVDIMFFNWRGSVVGGANARTTISLANSATTSVQSVSAYDAGELAGWVFIDGTANTRFYIQAQFAKNGAGTDFNISYQTTGDTPPAGFSMTVTSVGVIQVTLPSVAGFSSATINYALNAPAVGATLPLSISAGLIVPDGSAISPLGFANVTSTGNFSVTSTGPSLYRVVVASPAAPITAVLPTNVKAGYRVRIEVELTGSTETNCFFTSPSIAEAKINGNGFVELMALVDNPSTAANWKIMDIEEYSLFSPVMAGAGVTSYTIQTASWYRRKKMSTIDCSYSVTCNNTVDTFGVSFSTPTRFAFAQNAVAPNDRLPCGQVGLSVCSVSYGPTGVGVTPTLGGGNFRNATNTGNFLFTTKLS